MPPLLGGAVQMWLHQVVPRLDDALLLSPAHPGLPRRETVGKAEYRRMPIPVLWRLALARFPRRAFWWRSALEGRRWVRLAARELYGWRGTIVVANRPWFVPPLKQAAPQAQLVLRADNDNFRDPAELAACDAVMTCSDFIGAAARRFASDAPHTEVVPYGVDLGLYPRWSPEERKQAKAALGVAERPVVLFVGRVVPDKGPHLLLEALPEVRRAVPDVALVIVGSANLGRPSSSPYERQVARLATELGEAVHLTGFVPPDELGRFWAAADVFAGPALWDEPSGTVYVESMASAVPPVATARGGIPEFVVDGETGLLLPPQPSASQVADRLTRLLLDPHLRERLGAAGRARVEERFTWDKVAEATRELLRSVRETR